MRDIWLVARFEVGRAVRTWRALALVVLFGVASAGAAYLFVQFIGQIENAIAEQLQVPKTKTPGTMLEELVASDLWRDVIASMAGGDHLVDFLVQIPPLAMFHLWFGFLLVPFFASSASAECIAIDVRSRAVRFEALRTGRLELVLGRFFGQVFLTVVAIATSCVVVWLVGVNAMVVADPQGLAEWLARFGVRMSAFSFPFIGIGVAASQITASPSWARVLAVGGTAGSWVAYGLVRYTEGEGRLPWLTDLALQVLPQGWIRGMWEPGRVWMGSATALVCLGLAYGATGYLSFARRDL